ncbi:MAG: sigma 54-interacting transcriptional regulator, partial [Succinivibrio dextrinosolvens]|nr:sigma 54-interacting transcriptional regulator [Succinivibrio dextrinosolvens]
RVLQEKEVERLGSRKTIALDVRVIATSNRDLKQAVAEKKFREDLYYRLNVFPLRWLPLSKRPLDIIPIAKAVLSKHATEASLSIPELTEEAQKKLLSYAWPGNVRELDNVMQRALILASGGKIDAGCIILDENSLEEALLNQTLNIEGISPALDLEQQVQNASGVSDDAVRNQKIPQDLGGELKQQEYQIILDALIEYRGSRQEVSEKLGISPRTLRYKIAKMREMGMIIPG